MVWFQRKAKDPTSLHTATLGAPRAYGAWSVPQRVRMTELAKRYGRWVHRCVTINAQAAASVRPRLFTADTTGNVQKYNVGKPLDRQTKEYLRGRTGLQIGGGAKSALQGSLADLTEIEKHPLLDLLADVNPHAEGFGFREAIYADLQIFGRSFSHLIGTDNGQPPSAMWRMLPQKTQVIPDRVEFVKGFKYGSGPDEVTYEPYEVLWIKLNDPADPWGGMGPLEAWLKTIDADFMTIAYQEWIFQRGGTPDTVLIAKDGMQEDQRRLFRKAWRKLFGKLYSREESVALLEGDISIQQLGHKPRDLEYAKAREVNRDEIGQAFGVPKALLTSDDVNLANAREGSITHMRNTVWPMIMRVEERINQVLCPLWSDRLILVHDNPIPEDRTIRVAERASKLQSGYSVNEIRAEDGEEAIDDPMADQPMVAAGLVPLGSVGMDALPELAVDAEPIDIEPEPVDETMVLTGAQIVAATAIVQSVVDGLLPLASARGQLRVMFNLDEAQADAMLAGIEGFESDKPDPPSMIPQPLPKPDDDDDEDDEKGLDPGETDLQSELWFNAAQPEGEIEKAAGTSETFAASMAKILRGFIAETIANVEGKKAAIGTMEGYMPSSVDLSIAISEAATPEIASALASAGLSSVRSVTGGGSGVSFDLMNRRSQNYIKTAGRRVGGQVSKTWSVTIQRQLVAGIDAGDSAQQIAKRLRENLTPMVPWKAEQVARTETAFAAMAGREEGWVQSGVVEGKRFVAAAGACEFCLAIEASQPDMTQLGGVFAKDQIVVQGDQGPRVLRVDYADVIGEPIHPNCRCHTEVVLIDVE